jgi:hypothetical protein
MRSEEGTNSLTSTLIAKQMLHIWKGQPNMKVTTIISTIREIYDGYQIFYGKAWRVKHEAWKMIYGDWETMYEKFPEVLNAIKAVNPGMKYMPNPRKIKGG